MGRIEIHNREVIASAEYRASQMDTWPSPLEERMKKFLEENFIEYESQKVFYIYAEDGWITRYYIADFFIPHANIIIEVDGKFHDDHRQHDKMRTREIQEQYPEVEVLRYKWKDLNDIDKTDDLLNRIG
jgi:very-short-patch-repair endonuclease